MPCFPDLHGVKTPTNLSFPEHEEKYFMLTSLNITQAGQMYVRFPKDGDKQHQPYPAFSL